jgi:hypothetical protein
MNTRAAGVGMQRLQHSPAYNQTNSIGQGYMKMTWRLRVTGGFVIKTKCTSPPVSP